MAKPLKPIAWRKRAPVRSKHLFLFDMPRPVVQMGDAADAFNAWCEEKRFSVGAPVLSHAELVAKKNELKRLITGAVR